MKFDKAPGETIHDVEKARAMAQAGEDAREHLKEHPEHSDSVWHSPDMAEVGAGTEHEKQYIIGKSDKELNVILRVVKEEQESRRRSKDEAEADRISKEIKGRMAS